MFWINVPLVAVALLSAVVLVPDLAGNRGTGRLDVLGALLSAAGLVAVVDAVIEGTDRGWTSATTTLEIAAGLVLFAAFVVRELHAANPLLDVRLFRHRAFTAATTSIAITMFALFGSLFALTQYLQLVVGYSPLSAGLRALPFAAGVMALAPVSSVLVRAVGARVIIPLGLTAMSAGLFVLAQVNATSGYGVIALGIAIMGVGMGLILAAAGESIMSVLPPEQAGVGSAVNDTVQELGGALGVAVIGSIVSASFRQGLDHSHLPKALIDAARPSIANANAVAAHAGPTGQRLIEVAHRSFHQRHDQRVHRRCHCRCTRSCPCRYRAPQEERRYDQHTSREHRHRHCAGPWRSGECVTRSPLADQHDRPAGTADCPSSTR